MGQILLKLTLGYLLCATMVQWTSAAPFATSTTTQGQNGAAIGYQVPYIIGGEPTARCQWPWMAALVTSDRLFVCGASLINSEWLLTAAHCVYNATVELYGAISAYNLTARDEVVKLPIAEIVINEGYVPTSYGLNDIAMLRLASPVQLNTTDCVEPIKLPSTDYDGIGNPMCSIIGWGRTSSSSSDPISEELTQKRVRVIGNDLCQHRWNKSRFGSPRIYSTNICIDEKATVSACEGDSGGPLQCYVIGRGWTIVGVSSWGSSACKRYPSVYMKVSDYDSWIIDVIAASSSSSSSSSAAAAGKMRPHR